MWLDVSQLENPGLPTPSSSLAQRLPQNADIVLITRVDDRNRMTQLSR